MGLLNFSLQLKNQGCGVATPLDAILFCHVTKEYAEKDT